MASNPYVNKVQYSNGTTIIDISTDTAVAADVAAGKYFHLATGERVAGTNSGGSGDGYVWQDANGYVHLSDEEGTQPIYDTLNVNASGTFTPAQGHAYNSVVVPSGTAGTPTATKGTVSNHAISVTPSVTNTAGYITGSTKTGTAVSVSASELVSGTYSVTSSGTKDVTNYASASVPSGSVTAPSSITGTSATVSIGTNTLTLSKTVSVTPSVTTAGYVSSGTAGNSSVSLTATVNTRSSSDLTASTLTVTAPSGYYANSATKTLSDANLSAGNIKKDVSIFGVTGSYTGGGSSNMVSGTFTTQTTTGATQTITIPYEGNGYPINVLIEPTGGFYGNTDFYNLIQRYVTVLYCASKVVTNTPPTWTGSGTAQQTAYQVVYVYKNSTSNSIVVNASTSQTTLCSGNDTAYANASQVVFKDSQTMNIYVASTSYGFASEIEYTYRIVYSE